MVTITPVILTHNRRKDGTYNVKLRVTWKGRSRYLATNVFCMKDDLTRTLKIKNPTILDQCAALVREMRGTIADLSPAFMESLDVEDIARIMRTRTASQSFTLDFIEYGRKFAAKKYVNTSHAYTAALGAFERYLGGTVDVNGITKAMLLDFASWVEAAPKLHYNKKTGEVEEGSKAKIPQGQATRHLAKLASIYRAARDEYNDEDAGLIVIPRDPFKGIRLVFPKTQGGQKNLGVDLIQRIIDAEAVEEEGTIRTALAVFLVSFCLMGANLADLYAAKPFTGNVWKYNRRKTASRRADKAEMRVTLPPQVCRYVAHLQGNKSWWLGKLHDLNPDENQITSRINRGLKQWCSREDVEPFTFYAVRHSWATIARTKCGIDKATVDECLCHVGDMQVADIYIERDWSIMDKANTEVLALFDFHEGGRSSACSDE